MARQSNNHVMKGARGMFGKQVVFKVRKGKQILAAPPNVDEDRVPTPNQLAAQDRFKFSSDYANEAIKDADLKDAYQKVASKRQSAQNMAFKDAYNPPKVIEIITQGYTGAVGNIIVVHAIDDFKVNSLYVSILDGSGALIEKGQAVSNKHGVVWVYTVTTANANIEGCKIVATAFDLPMNDNTMEVIV
jgi:hypothetical protein